MNRRNNPEEPFPEGTAPGEILLFAHRGCSGIAPENTLAAFSAAVRHGIPGVELDVHLSRDDRLLVFHDDNLKRITGRDALIDELPADEVRELDAGLWFAEEFRAQRIPLLEEVFDLLGRQVYYDIELKWGQRTSRGLEQRVLQAIRTRGLGGRCLISSFNPFCIRRVRALDPAQPSAHIYAKDPKVPWVLRRGGARWLIPTPYIKPRSSQVRRPNSFLYRRVLPSRVLAWTVDDPVEAGRLLRLGVRGLISNYPDRIASVIRDFAGSP